MGKKQLKECEEGRGYVSFSTKSTSPLFFKGNLNVKFLTPKLVASKSHSTKLQSGMQNLEQWVVYN